MYVLTATAEAKLVCSGAASDKVAALEKAGVIVTESPAQIGPTMLKVCMFDGLLQCLLTLGFFL